MTVLISALAAVLASASLLIPASTPQEPAAQTWTFPVHVTVQENVVVNIPGDAT